MFKRLSLFIVLCVTLPCAAAPTVLVMGDSLSAGYGIAIEKGWVQLLQQRLRAQGYPHTVVNASISGETTAGGLARLPAALDTHQPEIVLIELGANDGLRGLRLDVMRANLERMMQLSRKAGARPVLFEMRIPPNYGAGYAEAFKRVFGTLALARNEPLVPFFLGPIALQPAYFQDDGIHPTVAAQPLLLDAVWPVLEPYVKNPQAAAVHPKPRPARS